MCYISLYGALSLHNCSSSGSLVFAHLGRINYDCTSSNNLTDSYMFYRDIYSIYYSCKLQDLIMIHKLLLICKLPCVSFASLFFSGLLGPCMGLSWYQASLLSVVPSVSSLSVLSVFEFCFLPNI